MAADRKLILGPVLIASNKLLLVQDSRAFQRSFVWEEKFCKQLCSSGADHILHVSWISLLGLSPRDRDGAEIENDRWG